MNPARVPHQPGHATKPICVSQGAESTEPVAVVQGVVALWAAMQSQLEADPGVADAPGTSQSKGECRQKPPGISPLPTD